MSLSSVSQLHERIQFFNGQRLFADDLQALEAFHREMRWLHNQSLHQPGVGSGFAITGPKSAREVVIQPGYAIDDLGREIVLTESRTEPVPPVANDGYGRPVLYDLTVSYPSERDLDEAETREGICTGRGAVRLREVPVFCWVRLGPPPDRVPIEPGMQTALDTGRRIRLARAEVLNCQLEKPLSLAQRRNARPPARPYVACGDTPIQGWEVRAPSDTFGFGFEIARRVDTADAYFRNPPKYIAHIVGDRVFRIRTPINTVATVLVDGFLHLSGAKADEFRISMLVPEGFLNSLRTEASGSMTTDQIRKALDDALNAPESQNANRWHVDWMGVEG
jgi:hypothetical protein